MPAIRPDGAEQLAAVPADAVTPDTGHHHALRRGDVVNFRAETDSLAYWRYAMIAVAERGA